MSTPDNRSVNFLAYFAGAALREGVADGKAAGARFRRNRVIRMTPTIAACRRFYIMLADKRWAVGFGPAVAEPPCSP